MTPQQQPHKLLYLFGDQTFNLQPHLKQLQEHSSTNQLLESFLDQSYRAIRSQIPQLPEQTRNDFLLRVTSVGDLLCWKQEYSGHGRRCIAVEMAVACLFQVASFILTETECKYWPPKGNDQARVLGFCTGALAAAAISSSSNASDLVSLGAEAVGVAFRAGVLVAKVSLSASRASLSSSDEDELWRQSWATAVLGPNAEQAVGSFCDDHCDSPLSQKPYIIAYPPRGVTVSAPPSILAQLRASPVFDGFELKSLPIYGLYHAPHLFTWADVSSVVAGIDGKMAVQQNKTLVISGAGDVDRGDFKALLETAVAQILMDPLRWGKVVELLRIWCLETSKPQSLAALRIVAFGSKAGNLFLKQTDLNCSLVEIPGASVVR